MEVAGGLTTRPLVAMVHEVEALTRIRPTAPPPPPLPSFCVVPESPTPGGLVPPAPAPPLPPSPLLLPPLGVVFESTSFPSVPLVPALPPLPSPPLPPLAVMRADELICTVAASSKMAPPLPPAPPLFPWLAVAPMPPLPGAAIVLATVIDPLAVI